MPLITAKLTKSNELARRCAAAIKHQGANDRLDVALGPSSSSGEPVAVLRAPNSTADLLRDLNSIEGRLSPRITNVSLQSMKRRLADLLVGNLDATGKSARPLKLGDKPPLDMNAPRMVPAYHILQGLCAYMAVGELIRVLGDRRTPDPMFIPTLDKGLSSEPLKTSRIATAIRRTGNDLLMIGIQKEPITPAQRKFARLALAHSKQSSLDNCVPIALRDSVLSNWAEGKHVWRMTFRMSSGLLSAFKLDVSQLTFQMAQEASAWERQLDPDEADLRPYPYLYTLNEVLAVLSTVFLPPAEQTRRETL